jgi:acyl carrier protein
MRNEMALARTEIIDFLSERFSLGVDDLGDDEPLFSSGLLDSFNVAELVMFIEERTDCLVAAEDLSFENLDSVSRILAFARSLLERGR